MNKNNQHCRSVKTLELSGIGDEAILQHIFCILKTMTWEQPYISNAVDRIHALTERVKKS